MEGASKHNGEGNASLLDSKWRGRAIRGYPTKIENYAGKYTEECATLTLS